MTNTTRTVAMGGVALLALLSAVGARAQNASAKPAKAEADVSEVVVTGSRIRGVAPVGSPIVSVNRDDITEASSLTTAQLLQEIPQIYNLGVSENSRGQAGGGNNVVYGTGLNLRGISPFATLTLVDGHRVPQAGTTGQTIDPSVVPTMGLARADIVADGASAIYGSDAVAGVVNLILRRNVDGFEASARYGKADDYDERQLGLFFGKTWAGGQFTFAFENSYHSELNGLQRDFARADQRDVGGPDYRLTQCNPGNIVINGVSYAIPAGGVTPANVGSLVPNTVNRCDPLKSVDLAPKQDRNTVMMTFNQDLTDKISIYGSAGATNRSFQFKGPSSTGQIPVTLTVPRSNAYFVSPVAGVTSVSVSYSLFPDVAQDNYARGHAEQYNIVGGLTAKLPFGWSLDAFDSLGQTWDIATGNPVDPAALTAALASSNPATALNPFGGAQQFVGLEGALRTARSIGRGRQVLNQVTAKADGPLFELPGGMVRAAVGAESIYTGFVFTIFTGNVAALARRDGPLNRTDNAVFGEVFIPIVGPNNALPFVKRLDLSVAGRFERYSDVGKTSNPKIGLTWSPMDGIVARGSYGTSFRAPFLSDRSLILAQLAVNTFFDPTAPSGRTVGLTLLGGNPDVDPETAKTYTLGVDFNPTAIPGLRSSFTWFKIVYTNQILQVPPADTTILQRESLFAAVIQRNPTLAQLQKLTTERSLQTGSLPALNTIGVIIDGRPQNLGATISQGWDFQVGYRWSTETLGDFDVSTNGTYFYKYAYQATPTSPYVNSLNTVYNPLKWRDRTTVRWHKGALTAAATLNYVGAYNNDRVTPIQEISAYKTVDLHASYDLGDQFGGRLKSLTIGFDATNLLDEDPPYAALPPANNGAGAFDPTVASPIGRILAVSLGVKW